MRTPGRLGHAAGDLGQRARRADADRRRQPDLALDRLGDRARGALDRRVAVDVAGRVVQALAAAEVQVELVDARGLDLGRAAHEHVAHPARVRRVDAVAGRQVDRPRRQPHRLADRHARAHAERAHLVAARGDHAAVAGRRADDHRLALERRVEQPLDRHEERVEIEARDAGRRH
jgi:hypothetical protein